MAVIFDGAIYSTIADRICTGTGTYSFLTIQDVNDNNLISLNMDSSNYSIVDNVITIPRQSGDGATVILDGTAHHAWLTDLDNNQLIKIDCKQGTVPETGYLVFQTTGLVVGNLLDLTEITIS